MHSANWGLNWSRMSQSSTSWNGDIGTRYERLAAEYSKLRAQATVLKKGVLEERAKNDKLSEDLKSAENITRKLRSENESLTFRNEQLLKRVQNVQDELEGSQKPIGGKKKEKKKDGPSEREKQLETSLAILEEELKNKLSQNEKLTNKVEEVAQVNEMLTLQLRELKERIEEMDREGRGLQSRIPSRKIIENGTWSSRASSPSITSQSSISIPLSDSPLWQIAESGRPILSGMSTLLSLLEQRVRIFPYDASLEKLPPHVEQLGYHLGEASKRFAAADEETNRLFDEPADKWRDSSSSIISSMEEAMRYCIENLPSLLSNLSQEESRCAWSDSTLETLNERWHQSLCSLLSALSSLPSSITDSINGKNEELIELTKTISTLHQAIKNTQESFSARWLMETRLPVQTKKGKCVGTATRDSLLKMLGTSQKVVTRLNGVVKEMEEKEKEESEKEAKEEEKRKKREEEAEELLMSEEELPAPQVVETLVEPSLVDRKDSIRSTKSTKSLSPRRDEPLNGKKQSELDLLRCRVSELEGEREKMLLDIALMKRKIANGSNLSEVPGVSEEVEKHYRERLREISERVVKETSRGNYYNKECENLVRSVRCMEGERRKLEDDIELITREKLALFDELRMTQYGYETKLREMSDHLSRRLTLFK
ncbi:hypothetical protein PRIPAC_75494 [Pristionchus pacificus]|uniref:Coiled-coil domain-containing protein 128 n=1 Tax=Pristionchus pacificus TaxID=54126 RepID=A0A2A6CT08_PRIPA|nr:hypothetical protein PRIPAC_75494 [Pristionchus pacificus]|eukprot:PDM81250.1 hypothetical protein PRIPAC_36253 [Pristionchus pacificus]